MAKKKILLIDDDEELCELLRDFLTDKGYQVSVSLRGIDGVNLAKTEQPDLIVLDVDMPGMNGYEVCEKIRTVPHLQSIPVIMLTARGGENDEAQGLEAGADDYILKPFKPKGLLARIESAMGRSSKQLEANALTHLPGNRVIFHEIEVRIKSGELFSVLYADLNNFKAFNDRYGFIRGDQAITLTADILLSCFDDSNLPKPFLGHVGGDDFVGIIGSHDVEKLCNEILTRFDESIEELYDEEDRKQGKISTTDRKGNKIEIPIMGLAIAVVTNRLKVFKHPGEVALLAGDLKRVAKSKNQSAYIVDRRA